jgi:hypothetical protein
MATTEKKTEEITDPPLNPTGPEIPHVSTQVPPYMDPTGVTAPPVNIGDTVSYTPPCPGAAGAKPVLTDIQAQIAENRNAAAEKRESQAVIVQCLFCGGYHQVQQGKITDINSLDQYGLENIQEPAPTPDPPNEADLTLAADAVTGGSDSVEDVNDDSDNSDSDNAGDDSKGVQSTGKS